MAKECLCGCGRPRFSTGYSKYCQHKRTDEKWLKKSEEKSKRKVFTIKPISDSMAKKLKEYRIERDEYMRTHPNCEFEGCNKESNDLHHKAGRGEHLSNRGSFMSVCRKHHNWIHEHPKESRELGYLI